MQKVGSSPTHPPTSLLPKSWHSVFKRSLYLNLASYMSILSYCVDGCMHLVSQDCWVSHQVSISFDICITKTVQYSHHSWVCPALPEFSTSVGLSWIWALEESGLKTSGVPSYCVLLHGFLGFILSTGGKATKGEDPALWKREIQCWWVETPQLALQGCPGTGHQVTFSGSFCLSQCVWGSSIVLTPFKCR